VPRRTTFTMSCNRTVLSSLLIIFAGRWLSFCTGLAGFSTNEYYRVPFQVYIEDTDAYGVLYNANYVKYYARAFETIVGNECVISKIDEQKFKGSPGLGENVLVQAEQIDETDSTSKWTVVLTSDDEDSIYNMAQVTLSRSASFDCDEVLDIDGSWIEQIDSFRLFQDEIEMRFLNDKQTSFLSLFTVMKLFERSRSNFIGGPDNLKRLKDEEGLLCVVTSVDNGALQGNALDDYKSDTDLTLKVKNNFHIKRKKMIDCYQTLLSLDHTSIIAQAKISILAIDSESRRPKAIPKWLMDKLTSGDISAEIN